MEQIPKDLVDKFCLYKGLLFKWQKSINLVSRGTLIDFWNRHILDSLQLLPFIKGSKILDVGSGGGFPGLVLAIANTSLELQKKYPLINKLTITCIDSDYKKTVFLSEVARIINIPVQIINDRIENINEKFDIVTARGFADLKNLFFIVKKHSTYGLFLKGEKLSNEIIEASKFFNFKYETFSSITDKRGKVILAWDIEKINKK